MGVLVSGSGTLLQAILDGRDEHYDVVVVVSDRPGIKALDRADAAGVPAAVVDFSGFESREAFSDAVRRALEEHGVDLVAQAGFMRILSPNYVKAFEGRILNSHPALLPAFPGAHGVRDALAWGVKVTGTTIHFVDEEVDHGPIVAQEPVAVRPDDTEETLHERIKAVEGRLFPAVIRLYAQGRLAIEGRRVRVLDRGGVG